MDRQDHGSLALWAADCAEHVLPHFEEERPGDVRPRRAIEAGRAWARGGIKVSDARAAALAAHAAAREAARAEAHVATHASHTAEYAAKAVAYASDSATAVAQERDWQYRRLPEHLRPVAFPALGDG
jgi:hypothetical protein